MRTRIGAGRIAAGFAAGIVVVALCSFFLGRTRDPGTGVFPRGSQAPSPLHPVAKSQAAPAAIRHAISSGSRETPVGEQARYVARGSLVGAATPECLREARIVARSVSLDEIQGPEDYRWLRENANPVAFDKVDDRGRFAIPLPPGSFLLSLDSHRLRLLDDVVITVDKDDGPNDGPPVVLHVSCRRLACVRWPTKGDLGPWTVFLISPDEKRVLLTGCPEGARGTLALDPGRYEGLGVQDLAIGFSEVALSSEDCNTLEDQDVREVELAVLDRASNSPIAGSRIEARIVGLQRPYGRVDLPPDACPPGDLTREFACPRGFARVPFSPWIHYMLLVGARGYHARCTELEGSRAIRDGPQTILLHRDEGLGGSVILDPPRDCEATVAFWGRFPPWADDHELASIATQERRFRMMGLPEGEGRLVVSAPGYATASRRVLVPARGPLEIVLSPPGTLAVEVVGAGDPYALLTVKTRLLGHQEEMAKDGAAEEARVWHLEEPFRIGGLPPGSYEVELSAVDGTRVHLEQTVALRAGDHASVHFDVAERSGSVRGTIVQGGASSYVSFRRVSLHAIARGSSHVVEDGETNARGEFVFERMEEGRYALAIEGHSHPVTFALAQGESVDLGTIVLAEPVALEGVVLDASSRPTSFARVTLGHGSEVRRVTCDEAGNFRVEGLTEGTWSLIALADHRGAGRGVLRLRAGRLHSCTILLDQLISEIRVTVPPKLARELSEASCSAVDASGVILPCDSTAEGFRCRVAAPGTWRIQVSGRIGSVSSLVTCDGEDPVVLQIPWEGESVTGRVDAPGRQVLGIQLVQRGTEGIAPFHVVASTRTDEEGRFVLRGVPEGVYRCVVSVGDQELVPCGELVVPPREAVVITLP